MNTLDFGAVMKQDFWFDDHDLSCPYCEGQGADDCPTCAGEGLVNGETCPACEGDGGVPCPYCYGQGWFEVMYNTAFGVEYRPASMTWDEARKFAWDMGFCLIKHENFAERFLLMGMVGMDCTWIIHYTRWRIQGYLDLSDYAALLGSGGYVFLEVNKRKELIEYLKALPPTPVAYAQGYEREMKKLGDIAKETI